MIIIFLRYKEFHLRVQILIFFLQEKQMIVAISTFLGKAGLMLPFFPCFLKNLSLAKGLWILNFLFRETKTIQSFMERLQQKEVPCVQGLLIKPLIIFISMQSLIKRS